jgi:hypothetical protein
MRCLAYRQLLRTIIQCPARLINSQSRHQVSLQAAQSNCAQFTRAFSLLLSDVKVGASMPRTGRQVAETARESPDKNSELSHEITGMKVTAVSGCVLT